MTSASSKNWPSKRPHFAVSRLTLVIVMANTLGLIVLFIGTLLLSQYREGLISAKKDALAGQGQVLADVVARTAVPEGAATPSLNRVFAREVLRRLIDEDFERVRIYDADGTLVTDSRLLSDEIIQSVLPPIGTEEEPAAPAARWLDEFSLENLPFDHFMDEARQRTVRTEIDMARTGVQADAVRFNEDDQMVVSVAVPIQLVQTVHGVLVIEAGEIEELIVTARLAILPFFGIALAVALTLSLVLTALIAQPIRELATAADEVRLGLGAARRRKIPDYTRRKDEIGELSGALQEMTEALYDRLDAIESFAADVAHEIKNPLTSIRSAIETLPLAKTDEAKARLIDVIQKDVGRMDRLITDISNASRLDAELSRQHREAVDVGKLLEDVVNVYDATQKDDVADIKLTNSLPPGAHILGFPSSLGQVFRNLIDNARSFSPADATVRVSLAEERGTARIAVEDDGPGIPPDNLETIFERFYTERPAGSAFGKNSGLGLAIAKQIIEAHRGRIWAENRLADEREPGGARKGARFVVELPLAK